MRLHQVRSLLVRRYFHAGWGDDVNANRQRGLAADVSRTIPAADDAGGPQGVSAALAREPRRDKRGQGKGRAGKRVVTLTLPWPPSVNECKRPCVVNGKARLVNTAVLTAYYGAASRHVMEQGKRGGLRGQLGLRLVLHAPDRRWYDIDNRCKPVADALQKTGIIENDSKIELLVIERGSPVPGGKVVVTVEER